MDEIERIGKYSRIVGAERDTLKGRFASLYQDRGLSVRQIAEATGRSYGATHRLLVDAGVAFRPRGNQSA